MKKTIMFFIGIAGLLFSGCTSSMVYLRQTPSELVLANIKSENRQVACTFRSNVPRDYDLGGYKFCNVNGAYRSNLLAYINTKFSLVEQSDIVIDVVLLSCERADADVTALGKSIVNVFSFSESTDRLLTTKMVARVTIRSGQQVIAEKTITASDQFSYESSSSSGSADATKNSYDRVLDKSILMIDKFLSTFAWTQNTQTPPQQIPQYQQQPSPMQQPSPVQQQPANTGQSF